MTVLVGASSSASGGGGPMDCFELGSLAALSPDDRPALLLFIYNKSYKYKRN